MVADAVERAKGGCRFCHEVETPNPQPAAVLADWKILPPNIPSRWFAHGEFHHDSHRLLSCLACHAGVDKSTNTGDVLIPNIDVCRACHSARPAEWAEKLPAKAAETGPRHTEPLDELLRNVNRGARTSCIECHVYHDPDKDKWNGPFAP